MDERLVAWARAVKKQDAVRGRRSLPSLWLFTDSVRLSDPLAAAARLPRGLAGVVLRDDALVGREQLARAMARLCRRRRLWLSVAGDWRLAAKVNAGVHLRAGRRPAGMPQSLRALTSSAHDVADAVRAVRAGAALMFLSPIFPTDSHPDAAVLGPLRWGLAMRRVAGRSIGSGALGGISGRVARRLPPACRAVGAIGALGEDVAAQTQCLAIAGKSR